MNIFSWRALYNKLPTCDSLVMSNVPMQSSVCKFHGLDKETIKHIFTSCGLAMAMWSKMRSWCNIQPVYAFSFRYIMEISNVLRGDAVFKKAIHVVFMATTWSLWKHTNANIIFEGVQPPSSNSQMCDIWCNGYGVSMAESEK